MTQNPHAPQQTVCIGCGTLLAHPANSLYIQCPKCMITQNARENRANANPNGAAGTLLHDGNVMPTKPPKKKKDPNAPKAASNAYMIFCKERRAELKQENPDLVIGSRSYYMFTNLIYMCVARQAFGKIGAKLGEIWRTMSSEEKRPYEERASADRERYRRQMESYKTDGDARSDLNADETPSVLSNKRSNDSLDDGGALHSFESGTEDSKKRLKLESHPLAPSGREHESLANDDYHDVGLYGDSFADHQVEHPAESSAPDGSSVTGFGDHASTPSASDGQEPANNESSTSHLLDMAAGASESENAAAVDDSTNELVLNVHHSLGGSDLDAELPNSPDA